MPKENYDFAGWVTKNDILCSDGVVIKHDAFKNNDGQKVPLVWNHNYSATNNVLGHVVLHNHEKGVYGYGYLNNSEEGTHAKELIRHGDISAMSIGARKLKKTGKNIVHGMIYEVSLVLAGANPGALIEHVMTHSDDGEEVESEQAVIFTDMIIHSAESLPEDDEVEETPEETPEAEEPETTPEEEPLTHAEKEKTIGEIIATMNEEQVAAVTALVGEIVDEQEDGDDDDMKQNVFAGNTEELEVLTHSEQVELFADAKQLGSFKEAVLQHGITNIEMLFPEAHNLNPTPTIYRDTNTGAAEIVAAISKSPFSRIRTQWADFTADEARARGYIKGKEKLEQIFPVAKRETTPQTIYKKQKLDRDDIIDITDFDVVAFINKEMRFMIIEEMARAALVGDGRSISDESKIKEDKIRPIISDDDFYTLKKTYPDAAGFMEAVIKGMVDYKGSGAPTMFIDQALLADVKLLKGTDGRWLAGHIPTTSELAAQFGVSKIVETTFMKGKGALVVNLKDYTFGSTKGGQLTSFDDFDIDFNQYKYLIETRLSGALTVPHAAVHFAQEDVVPAG